MVRTILGCLLLLGLMVPVPRLEAADETGVRNETPWPLTTGMGVIRELDFGTSTFLLGGMTYVAAIDVQVEIGGGPGAFTMLQPGMQIAFEYLQVSDEERRVTRIRQIPPQVQLDDV